MDNFTRSVTYDVVNQISLVNNGTVAASPTHLIVALIPSITPHQKVISMEFDSQHAESFSDAYGNRYAKFVCMTDLSPGARIDTVLSKFLLNFYYFYYFNPHIFNPKLLSI